MTRIQPPPQVPERGRTWNTTLRSCDEPSYVSGQLASTTLFVDASGGCPHADAVLSDGTYRRTSYVVWSIDPIVPRTLIDLLSNETSRTSAEMNADPVPVCVRATVLGLSPSSSPALVAVSQVCGAAGQSSTPPLPPPQ